MIDFIELNESEECNHRLSFRLYSSHSFDSKNDLEARIYRIEKKLGGQNVKIAIKLLEKNNLTKLCGFLLQNYYDKMYDVAYENRESEKKIIPISNERNQQIIKKILSKV